MTTLAAEALDLTAISAWLTRRGVRVTGPLQAELIEGGLSNLTFFLSDSDGNRWVLRRPPLGNVLSTAHDVGRECRVLTALADTSVPVPKIIGSDVDGHGTPYYVMEEVAGVVLRHADQASLLDEPALRRTGKALIEGLAKLHGLDPTEVGLERLGRGEDYLARQIAMWQAQAEHHRVAPATAADTVRDRLLDSLPPQQETTIVHGDYKLDNVLVDERGDVAAILDWELCTRGDPLVDVAVCVYYWTESSDATQPFERPPSSLEGMPSRAQLLEHYAAVSGRNLDRPDYYFAYAAWRLALVFEGVIGRSRAGAYGATNTEEESRLQGKVADLIGEAETFLAKDGRA